MLRSIVLAFLALLVSSDAFSVTLVPVPLTSVLQTINPPSAVIVSDPTHAVANWSDPFGMGTSEAKIEGGALQLSNLGTITTGDNQVETFSDVQFTVPDVGAGTTSIVFRVSQVSSQLSGVVSSGVSIRNPGSFYLSVVLGNVQVLLPSPLEIEAPTALGPNQATAATENFLAGDTVQLDLASQISYEVAQGTSSGTYSESFTVQVFAAEPTPEPSTIALLGTGLAVLGFLSRRTA